MTRLEKILIVLVAIGLVGALIGLGFMWGNHNRPTPENIAAAPAVVQRDGSVVAERRPDPAPSPAPHALPKGSTEERRVHVVVQPRAVPPKYDASGTAFCECGPVAVDLSLVRVGDGKRVVASSPDGTVVSALDIPIEPALVPPEPKTWAAGLSYNPTAKTAGVWLEKDLARVRLGLDLNQARDGGAEARIRAGWVF